MGFVQQHPLFGRQVQPVPAVENRLNAGEQTLVQEDIVPMLGQAGIDLLGQSLQFVVGVGRGEIEKHRADTVQQGARAFEPFDGVLERRRLGVFHQRRDRRQLRLDASLKGRCKVLVLDLLERRRGKRCIELTEKRILHRRLPGKAVRQTRLDQRPQQSP
jgi:hypothetical protein